MPIAAARWRGGRRVLAAAAWFACAAATAAPPAPGRYAAQLCVTGSSAEPQCGPADIEWRGAGSARLRISDIVYALQLHTSQVDVVLKHGAMQIDAFTSIYEWDGATLRFVDTEKNLRYEVQRRARLNPRPAARR